MPLHNSFAAVDAVQYDLKSFDCGKEGMNKFLSRYAVKNKSLGISATWVLPSESEDIAAASIAAYYTLAASTLSREVIPVESKLPAYPVPVVLLARLAVDRKFQGQGLGEKTLVQALRHAVALCERGLPAFGLVLDVLDEDALAFYQKFDLFDVLTDNPMRLFVSMNTLKRI